MIRGHKWGGGVRGFFHGTVLIYRSNILNSGYFSPVTDIWPAICVKIHFGGMFKMHSYLV